MYVSEIVTCMCSRPNSVISFNFPIILCRSPIQSGFQKLIPENEVSLFVACINVSWNLHYMYILLNSQYIYFNYFTLLLTFGNNNFTCLFVKAYFEKCISLPLIATVKFSEMQVRCQMKASLLFCRNFFFFQI